MGGAPRHVDDDVGFARCVASVQNTPGSGLGPNSCSESPVTALLRAGHRTLAPFDIRQLKNTAPHNAWIMNNATELTLAEVVTSLLPGCLGADRSKSASYIVFGSKHWVNPWLR